MIHDGVMHLGEESQIHQKLMNIEMRNVKYWILLSNYVRCRLEKHLNCQKPYCTIPHGPINYSNICCSNNIPKKYNLLFIGRINYYKGIHLLMDAINYLDFNKIDNIIIAGVIDKSIDVSILRQYRQVKIINKFLSNEEFEELVLKSHILLMPYLEASQSGIAAISLGYNIPAIATRVGGLPEQLSEDVAYFMEASVKNNLFGMLNMAQLYRDGLGVEKDVEKARELYHRAYNSGYTDAMVFCGQTSLSSKRIGLTYSYHLN